MTSDLIQLKREPILFLFFSIRVIEPARIGNEQLGKSTFSTDSCAQGFAMLIFENESVVSVVVGDKLPRHFKIEMQIDSNDQWILAVCIIIK